MAETETHTIICATCNVGMMPSSNPPKPDDISSCPECGVSDTYENVLEEAKAYAVEHAARQLQKKMKEVASGSRGVTYKPGRIETREYRFIVVPR